MKYIITYTSYLTYKDKEVYTNKTEAERRLAQLAKCKAVTKLQMIEREN